MSSIELSWLSDGVIDSYSVYRNPSSFEVDDLPSPIATGITDKYYSDTDVVSGEVYFYRVGSISSGIEKISSEIISVSADSFEITVFNLTYDESSHDELISLSRLNSAPLITPDGLLCNGYDSRLVTRTFPSYMNGDNLGLQATISFYNARLKTTSASEPVVFIGEDGGITAKPRFSFSINQDPIKQAWSYLALEYYDTVLRTVPIARSGWKYESAFPKINDYAIKPKPQALYFIDDSTIVVTAHYEDTESKAFKMDLNTKEVTGEFSFGTTTDKHVSAIAKSADGSVWFCDYLSGTIFKVDLTASFANGIVQKSNVCNFSAASDLGGIDFITLSGIEYLVFIEYSTTGSPYIYLLPSSLLTSGYTFKSADSYKRFVIGRRVQGVTFNNDKLYVSRNRDYQAVDAAGYIETFNNISSYFSSTASGATMTPNKQQHAPSVFCEDCKFRPNTSEFWTMTEGFSSIADYDNWLSIWSSSLDDSEVVNTYTLNKQGSSCSLLINGILASTFSATPSVTAAAISFGGYPTAAAGIQNGFSTAKVKNVALTDSSIDFSTYSNINSGSHESNVLTTINLTLTNPGAESGTTGWVNEIGSISTRDFSPPAKFGSNYFAGGANVKTVSKQRVNMLSAAGISQSELDAKEAWIVERWYQASYSNQDPCGMGIRQLNASQAELSTDYPQLLYVPFGDSGVTPNWYKRHYSSNVLDSCNYVDSIYRSDRDTGTNNDGYIDEISVTVYMK